MLQPTRERRSDWPSVRALSARASLYPRLRLHPTEAPAADQEAPNASRACLCQAVHKRWRRAATP